LSHSLSKCFQVLYAYRKYTSSFGGFISIYLIMCITRFKHR